MCPNKGKFHSPEPPSLSQFIKSNQPKTIPMPKSHTLEWPISGPYKFIPRFLHKCKCLSKGQAKFQSSEPSRDRKMVGDVTGAQSYASTAKCLNIWALVMGLLVIITFFIISCLWLTDLFPHILAIIMSSRDY
uniref:Uncharacterized protein n=1 Tax=Equus asinus asinus TaxID=83772 RepID=A0A8C4MGR6_EQUAS